ncbi:MAG TPA: sensor histidine kinase, partial [Amycolatopsis sp.]|nr:sensor histidine kinase [Amycolatopsis sp.]
MDAVSGFSLAQIVPWGLVTLLGIAVIVLLVKQRRPASVIEDAMLQAVHRMSKAAPNLRSGLDEDTADKITTQLLQMLDCVAVGITDCEGTLLSWDGEANEHYM